MAPPRPAACNGVIADVSAPFPLPVQMTLLQVGARRRCPEHGKNGFVTATKLGTTNNFFVAATKNFAAATKRFVDRTKHFVDETKYF